MVFNLIPKGVNDDHMFNRRLLAYYGLLFTVYWAHLILISYFVLAVKDKTPDAAIIIAFLGVPGTLAGIGFWKYLKAAENDDVKSETNNSRPSRSNNDTSDVEDRLLTERVGGTKKCRTRKTK